MQTFLISYDLKVPETHLDYVRLANHIKGSYTSWARPVKSVWIIKSNESAVKIRDNIKLALDSNDKLIVLEISRNWATYSINKDVTDWMKKNI